MGDDGVLIVSASEVAEILAGREAELIETVRRAYLAHGAGESSLPHSTFLRFPGNESDRIIALPAYLGDDFHVAGVKWIASFPHNVQRGIERASAVLVLNSCDTGRPEAILEASMVSARRTAASAAAAAHALLAGRAPASAGLIGTGVINREVARFLRVALPGTGRLVIFDLDPARAAGFAEELRRMPGELEVAIAPSAGAVLSACPLVSFATTAVRPHVDDLSSCPPGAVILHLSLRDLTPRAILAADNVVDDPDHVSRAATSIHLAEQATGSRDFIRCTLAEILSGRAPARRDDGAVAVFSPFGLGILDLAVGKLVLEAARAAGKGTFFPAFFGSPSSLG